MRINSSQLPENNVVQVRTRTGVFTHALEEGDIVKAEVLSGEKGAVVMQAEGGQVFRARLSPGVSISRGEEVYLQVTGKEDGVLYLSLRELPSGGDAERQAALVREFEDKSLLPFAAKLAQQNMTVTEESARAMRDLTIRYPEMPLEEAAFIAANGLYSDDDILKAAMAFLSGGEKTDAMIEKLMVLLNSQLAANSAEQAAGSTGLAADSAGLAADIAALASNSTSLAANGTGLSGAAAEAVAELRDDSGNAGAADAQTFLLRAAQSSGDLRSAISESAPVTDFLSFLRELLSRAPDYSGRAPQTDGRIISQGEGSLQFRNDVNVEENSQNVSARLEKPVEESQERLLFTAAGDDLQAEMSTVRTGETLVTSAAAETLEAAETANAFAVPQDGTFTSVGATAATAPQSTNEASTPGFGADAANASASSADMSLRSQFTTLLSSLREFRGTPAPALERFSDLLLRVASDSMDVGHGDAEKLSDLLASLFAKIERNGAGAGEKLKAAKDELFARLSMIEEAISKAAPTARGEMLEQTRRLMDHVRALNNIDQFAYMQIPVMLGSERKTAELYLFRRKGGGKRIDPENINILLALDLEYLGHWEALLNIRNRDVSVRMQVPGALEKDYFNRNTTLLHKMLEEAGFRLVSADVSYSGEETTPLTVLTILDKLSTGRIDYVV